MKNKKIGKLGSFQKSKKPKIKEREILRIAANFPTDSNAEVVSKGIHEILVWAYKRSGGKPSKKAWNGESFEDLRGGRSIRGTHFLSKQVEIWALRAEDPDKQVPGRNWTTEVVIGQPKNEAPLLGVRLLMSTSENIDDVDIEPAVPGLILQLVEECNIEVNNIPLWKDPRYIDSDEDMDELITLLTSNKRKRPVFVVTEDKQKNGLNKPLINVNSLAHATIGLAHVVIVSDKYTYSLSDEFGRVRSVFRGAVRIYKPGFNSDSNPFSHHLFLPDNYLYEDEGSAGCVKTMRQFAAKESLLRCRLHKDVLTFDSIRNAVNKHQISIRDKKGEKSTNLLKKQIKQQEEELRKTKDDVEVLYKMCEEAEERANTSESRLREARAQITTLKDCMEHNNNNINDVIPIHSEWKGFADWCDEHLSGRVALAKAARRGIRNPDFNDAELVSRCLLWLANEYRDRRIEGGGDDIANQPIESIGAELHNTACGNDKYEFEFRGKRLQAEWHIKKGGNTRDPARCLRIYYGWDPEQQLIVISDMPAHRRTGAS